MKFLPGVKEVTLRDIENVLSRLIKLEMISTNMKRDGTIPFFGCQERTVEQALLIQPEKKRD
jgi:hypothetical protein